MEKDKLIDEFKKLGLSEKLANYYGEREAENNNEPWLAAFRFVRPLNNDLKYYKETYSSDLREGCMYSEASKALLEAGVSPEQIAEFAFEMRLEAYNSVLYRLDDAAGGDYDLPGEGDSLPSWSLMERSSKHQLTGRLVQGLHSLLFHE